MNVNLLNIVKQIVAEQGEDILSNPQRMKAYFSDLAKDEPKPDRIAFGRCVEHGFAQTLKNVAVQDRALCKQRLAQKLRDEEGLDSALCADSVELLAEVLFGEEQKNVTALVCSNCGKELQKEWQTCPYCSTPVGKTEQVICSVITSGSGSGGYGVSLISLDKPLLCLTGHTHIVNSIAYSPDGKYLASGSYDKTIKIWDAVSGRNLQTLEGHTKEVTSVAYSPNGKYLASGSWGRTVIIWDAVSGNKIQTFEHDSYVSMACSPDWKYIASAGSYDTIIIQDAVSGKKVNKLALFDWLSLSYGKSILYSIAYSRDGKYLASGYADKTIRIWDTVSGKNIQTLKGHTEAVNFVYYSPDGKYLVSGSSDKTIKIWDAESGKIINTIQTNNVSSLVYSPDVKNLMITSFNWIDGSCYYTTTILDAVSGRNIQTLDEYIDKVVYSPDGKYIAGTMDKTIKILDAASAKTIKTINGHIYTIRSVAFSPNGKYLASGSDDHTVKIWDTALWK